jgi:hypothetical protein
MGNPATHIPLVNQYGVKITAAAAEHPPGRRFFSKTGST